MKHLVNQTGFTLVEMLITITLIGIISAMAAPSFQSQIARMKQKDTANTIEMALKQARTDTLVHRAPVVFGIKDQQVITAQAINNAKDCTITSANSNTCKVTKISLDKKITVDVQNAKLSDTLYFTVNKKVYLGLPSDSTPQNIDANFIIYGLCYEGVSGEKYAVTINNISKIAMGKYEGGNCS